MFLKNVLSGEICPIDYDSRHASVISIPQNNLETRIGFKVF